MPSSSAITVTDPSNDNSSGRVSTTYAVNTKHSSVRRKYSDFQWLQVRLAAETPGAIVPIIPHKYALDKKFEPDFIEERRHSLQRFLQNVMEHPELALPRVAEAEKELSSSNANDASDRSALRVFLTIPLGDDFDTAKKSSETSTTTTIAIASSNSGDAADNDGAYAEVAIVEEPTAAMIAKKGISSFFSKAMTLTQVTAGSVELVETEGEDQIHAVTSYVNQVEGHVTKLLKCAHAIVKLTADQADQFDELGIPVGGWRTTYQNNTSTANDDKTMESMSAIVQFTTNYSELLNKRHDKETAKFLEAMECLSLDLKAFQAALNQRYDFRVHYTAKYKKLKDKESAISKLRGKDPESVSKAIQKMQTERDEMRRKADLSKRRLEECTRRVLRESERTRLYFERSLKAAVKSYGKMQMEYNQKATDAWSKVLPYLD
jgi:hypothetical protein